jgi:hypothetical protein
MSTNFLLTLMIDMCITKAKIKRADSGNLKGTAPYKLYRGLTANCSEMPASF